MHITITRLSVLALVVCEIAPCSAKKTVNLTPDNTCGGKHGYICNPALAQGGPCCSQSGWCGSTSAYCGAGCQPGFGNCSSSISSSSKASIHTTSSATRITTSTKAIASSTFSIASTTPTSSTSCQYTVDSLGTFTNFANYTFLTPSLPFGLFSSNYAVGNPPYQHTFLPSNIAISSPYLHLLVPGSQRAPPYSSAQLETSTNQILYASVRTTAIFSSVPGTCHGLFFYKNDNQEIDIEFLTNKSAQANQLSSSSGTSSWTKPEKNRLPLHYTNQAVKPGVQETTAFGPGASNDTDEEHEYRIDWTEGEVAFYLDGVLQQTFTSNVPTEAGSWMWSNWANGNPGWTTGPPGKDSVLQISNIVMYYNTTSSSVGQGSCA